MGRRPGRMVTLTGRPGMRSPGRPPVRRDVERGFWVKVAAGLSSEEAAIACGVSGPVGVRWFRVRGGMPSMQLAPSSGRYLSYALFEYLEIFHNRQRRHSMLGMLTPVEYETRHGREGSMRIQSVRSVEPKAHQVVRETPGRSIERRRRDLRHSGLRQPPADDVPVTAVDDRCQVAPAVTPAEDVRWFPSRVGQVIRDCSRGRADGTDDSAM